MFAAYEAGWLMTEGQESVTKLAQSQPIGARLDERLMSSIGISDDEYRGRRLRVANEATLRFVLNLAEAGGWAEELEVFRNTLHPSAAGRPPIIPTFSALLLEVMFIFTHGAAEPSFIAVALEQAFTSKQLVKLGIKPVKRTQMQWYKLYCAARQRLVALMNPFPSPVNRRLTGAETRIVVDNFDESAMERLQTFMNRLLQTSLDRLPNDARDRYRGNISLDATRVDVLGMINPSSYDADRNNADPIVGHWNHEGSHGGDLKKDSYCAYELQTVLMAPNKAGTENTLEFPLLISGIAFNTPGSIRETSWMSLNAHYEYFQRVGDMLVDRAYSSLAAGQYQTPARKAGFTAVYDFRIDQLGQQASFKDLIMVDGNWYVMHMPDLLITAELDYRNNKIDAKTRKDRIFARRKYMLTAKGRVDSDGYRRFSYPDPAGYTSFDRITGEVIETKTAKSVTIPSTPEFDKFVQEYQYRSKEWFEHYGMRSHVEASNKLLKDRRVNLGDPKQRRARGYAAQYLAVAIRCMIENIHRMFTFITKTVHDHVAPKRRARRRSDSRGKPLLRTGLGGPSNKASPLKRNA